MGVVKMLCDVVGVLCVGVIAFALVMLSCGEYCDGEVSINGCSQNCEWACCVWVSSPRCTENIAMVRCL